MSHMLDEIGEQPAIVAGLARNAPPAVAALAAAIRERDIRFVYIAARGTSDHVAHYAKYCLEIRHGIPVALAAPSVFTIYDVVPALDEHTLVMGISQSGAGPDVIEVVARSRARGALTACITNCDGTALADAAEYSLVTPAGPEQSVAATKTYTSAVAMVALLSYALRGEERLADMELSHVAEAMHDSLGLRPVLADAEGDLRDIDDCIVLGRGFNHGTALEAALKLTETCSIGGKSFSAADFLHGPVAAVGAGFPVLVIGASGKPFQGLVSVSNSLVERGARVYVIAAVPEPFAGATAFRIPQDIPEWLSPLVYALPAQLLACELSVAKGLDPDQPRGLHKVTKTL